MTTIEPPYMGRWQVTDNGASIGVVTGDFVLGFIARDQDGSVLGHYPTYARAMYAVLNKRPADCPTRRRDLICAT